MLQSQYHLDNNITSNPILEAAAYTQKSYIFQPKEHLKVKPRAHLHNRTNSEVCQFYVCPRLIQQNIRTWNIKEMNTNVRFKDLNAWEIHKTG